ncbi:MAG TPA: hypothetical protein VL400_20215 [Polyangiaceae bacterium]|jgi:hypothetical protein|nr:hypothetical protein [Polyangiaceae bacterium]
MAKASSEWKVLPHRPIEKLSERVWRVEGDLDPLKRVMTIAKQSNGDLVVHNGIALEEELMAEIDAWGPVRTIVVPNGFHRLDAAVFKKRYPAAKVLCPSGATKKVAEVVPVDGSYEDFAADDAVRMETLEGTKGAEGALIVTDDAGTTVVLNDAMFNMPHLGGFTGFVFKTVTGSSGGPKVSRLFRTFMMKDKAAFRAHLERLAALPGLARIIVSHHETIESDAAGTLRAVASSL